MNKLLFRFLYGLPSKLPQGVTEFNEWSDSILYAYDMPNNDSTKFALATQILHLNQTDGYKPKRYFGLCLIKGAASQVAHSMMMEFKAKQEERVKAEEAAKLQEPAQEDSAVSVS